MRSPVSAFTRRPHTWVIRRLRESLATNVYVLEVTVTARICGGGRKRKATRSRCLTTCREGRSRRTSPRTVPSALAGGFPKQTPRRYDILRNRGLRGCSVRAPRLRETTNGRNQMESRRNKISQIAEVLLNSVLPKCVRGWSMAMLSSIVRQRSCSRCSVSSRRFGVPIPIGAESAAQPGRGR